MEPIKIAEEFVKKYEYDIDSNLIVCSKIEFYSFCSDFADAIHNNVKEIINKL